MTTDFDNLYTLITDMPPTKAPTEFVHVTDAAADGGDADLTTVSASNTDGQVIDLLAGGYLTVIVVVVIIVVLTFGLVAIKSYTTWVSTRTSRRRRHSSQRWLTEDNPQIWTDKSFDDGEIIGLSLA